MQHRYDYLFSSAMNIYKYLNIELTQLRHVIVGKEWCCTPHDNVNRLYITLDGEGSAYYGIGNPYTAALPYLPDTGEASLFQPMRYLSGKTVCSFQGFHPSESGSAVGAGSHSGD